MDMSLVEWIIWLIVLAIVAFAIGYMVITLPSIFQKIPPKRYHFKEPASTKYKDTVKTKELDSDNGSAVDQQKALSSFES